MLLKYQFQNISKNGYLNISEFLKEIIQFFDKDLRNALRFSYKKAQVPVEGINSDVKVSQESVYDTELMRILFIQ